VKYAMWGRSFGSPTLLRSIATHRISKSILLERERSKHAARGLNSTSVQGKRRLYSQRYKHECTLASLSRLPNLPSQQKNIAKNVHATFGTTDSRGIRDRFEGSYCYILDVPKLKRDTEKNRGVCYPTVIANIW
jgi:hypothetical protein